MIRPKFIPLHALLSRGRPADTPVAISTDGIKTWGDLFLQVAGWRETFSHRVEPHFALYKEDCWDFICALLGAWAAGKQVTIIGEAGLAVDINLPILEIPAAISGATSMPKIQEFSPGSFALTVCTSGTTGVPVALPKRFSQLGCEVETLENIFGSKLNKATMLATVSHQHIYGLLFKILWPLCAGRLIHLQSLFYPEEILASALLCDSFALISSPAHLKRLPETLDWSRTKSRCQAVFSSGGPLSVEAASRVHEMVGSPITEIYGSSETGGIAWRELGRKAGSWQTFPDVEVRIDAASSALSVRSPKLPNNEWFVTSDRAMLAGNSFELLGRLDRIVKVEEKRVSLNAVERLLLATGLVNQARIVPLLSNRDELGAVIVPNEEGMNLGHKALREHLRTSMIGKIEPVAIPRYWRFAEAFPLDAQGKTSEAVLRKLFEEPPRWPEVIVLKKVDSAYVELSLRLQKELLYFQGHFPALAILPGVVQIDWAIHYGRQHLDLKGEFQAMEVLKFQQILKPGDEPRLILGLDSQKGKLRFEYCSIKGRHSSGTLTFRA